MLKTNPAVLGVFLTETTVEGILLRRDDENRIHLIDRYVRHRARKGEAVLNASTILPGLKDRSESDYTMEVGDGSQQATDLFLAREFNGGGTAVADKVKTDTAARRSTTPFGAQLREILSECREAGFPNPKLAFCIGSSEVIYQELGIALNTVENRPKKLSDGYRLSKEEQKTLIARLEETVQGEIDKRKVAFLPMVKDSGRDRFLGIVPTSPDPISAALDVVARSSKASTPTAYLADSEISLLISLVRRRKESEKGNTAIVRVSASDTIALFLKDGILHKYEHLRSLTSYDALDTVCSRVVLKQDELRIGSIDEIYVSTEHQGVSAISTFESFFPEASVHELGDLVREHGLVGSKVEEVKANSVPAAGVALRLLSDWDQKDKEFPSVNLLDKKRRGAASRKQGFYAWHTLTLLVLLFGTALFFTWRYMANQETIDLRNEEVRLNPPQFPTQSAEVLRARVASLQQESENYTRAMFVLDSLLIGSDKWSRTLDEITRSTGTIGRLWLKAWTPLPGQLRLEGNALERNRIAALAQRWGGSIEKLNFAEIQGLRVYSFIMTVPIASEIPEVALYLREQSIQNFDPAEAEAITAINAQGNAQASTN